MLKSRLQSIAKKYDIEGIDALLDLTPEDYLDLETFFNENISSQLSDKEFNHYVKVRLLFRIFLKYGRDIQQGLGQLTKYENDE